MRETSFAISETIAVLLTKKKYHTIRDIVNTMHAADIAAMCEDIPKDELSFLFRLLPKELAAETFTEMDSDIQELLIHSFTDEELRDLINKLFVDDTVAIIDEMPANVVARILSQTNPDKRRTINEILSYAEDSAGSVMTTEYVTLFPKMTIGDAVMSIRNTGMNKETIYTCYVTDETRLLLGHVSLKMLILSDEDSLISDIMEKDTISVKTNDDQEEMVYIFLKYSLNALPVVDNENRIVGIVTVDDAIDIMEEEATEDIEKMAAITPSDKPYMKMSVFEIWWNRTPWLILMMVSATFSGMIITSFEHALAAQMVLSAFIPMLMNSGGNAGSQASVSIIRAISLGELHFSDMVTVIWKELRVSVLCGLALSIASMVKIYLVDMLLMNTSGVTITVAFVVSASLAFTVICAKVIGCILPLIARKIGFDPAVMASPFVTTIVDAFSLIIYFQIATNVLKL